MSQRCGFVSVIGLPNAGKSTLVNAMVGSKVSIVSRKMQTTRARLLGIALHDESQIILIDTPGIFKPKKTLEKAMVGAALSSFEGAECIVHMIDASMRDCVEKSHMILEALKGQKAILVLNKVDQIEKSKLLEISQKLNDSFPYAATFMISALNGKGLPELKSYLSEALPESEWMYPEDQISDISMRVLAAEITREKVFDKLHQEIPYSIYVETEDWEQFDNGDLKISQIVYVQKDSQKGIVLGKGGAKIKSIGKAAREELSDMMECAVHLKLFVRVQENWPERPEFYEAFGLEPPLTGR